MSWGPCITCCTVLRRAASVPPGWRVWKRAEVKPRRSSSATARASPSASWIRLEEVGARSCGQASRTRGSSSSTSAARPSVLSPLRVMATSGIEKRAAEADEVGRAPRSPRTTTGR